MNDSIDANKLGQAVESLAKLRQFAEEEKLNHPDRMAALRTKSEGWVGQKAVAEHLQISRRTLYDWMQKRV